MNRVILFGRVHTEPYIKTPVNKNKFAAFILATNERWIDANGKQQERTDYHKVVVFKPLLAEWCQSHLIKGSKVLVEGKLSNHKHTNESGENLYASHVVIGGSYGYITCVSPLAGNEETADDEKDRIALERASSQHLISHNQFSSLFLRKE